MARAVGPVGAIEVVHIEDVEEIPLAQGDIRAGIVQGTHPALAVKTAEKFVHQIGREDAFGNFVLSAEPDAQGVADAFRLRAPGKFVLLPERKGQVFLGERFGKAKDALVLGDLSRRRDLPVFVAEVALEPLCEIVAAASHRKPAFRSAYILIGAVFETRHQIGGSEGLDQLYAGPGSEIIR